MPHPFLFLEQRKFLGISEPDFLSSSSKKDRDQKKGFSFLLGLFFSLSLINRSWEKTFGPPLFSPRPKSTQLKFKTTQQTGEVKLFPSNLHSPEKASQM
jgi:hypothetical protein